MAQKIYTDLDVKGKITSQNDEIQIGKTTVIVPQAPAGEHALSITIPTTESIQTMIDNSIDSSEVNQYIITGEYGKTPSEVLKAHTFSPEPKDGDTAVVRIPLFTGEFDEQRYSYTAYVFDNNIEPAEGETKWIAMDGNYSASNVYFTENIEMAGGFTKVGNISESDKTLEINGKSLADLISRIFQKELNPSPTWPKYTVTSNANISTTNVKYYEVGETLTPTFTVSPTTGSYTYGTTADDDKSTGVTWTDISVTFNGETISVNPSEATTGTFNTLTITDANIDSSISFSAEGDHTAATYSPLTNLGNVAEGVTLITAKNNVAPASKPKEIKGYRKWFYGSRNAANKIDPATDITSAFVRNNLTGVSSLPVGSESSQTLNVTDMQQLFVAIPKSAGLSNATVTFIDTSSGAPAGTTESTEAIVRGANDYVAAGQEDVANYDVFYISNGNASYGNATYKIEIIA